MILLFIFLDGVGIGKDDPSSNPFSRANLPNLNCLLGERRLTDELTFPVVTEGATLIALDTSMGVEGLPQSATGQAALLSGINVPLALKYHYGPKPNPEVASFIKDGNLFSSLMNRGKHVTLLNAYPPRYFDGIESGRRLPGAIAMAAYRAGVRLNTKDDLYAGQALSADFTGQGWRDQLGYSDAPVLSPSDAGKQAVRLAIQFDFSLFEYWLTDIVGHHQDMAQACLLLETFDQVLGGLLESWDDNQGIILITSDHGNLEDLSTRRHTLNPVPLLLVGVPELRQRFLDTILNTQEAHQAPDLTRVAPAIIEFLTLTGY